MMRVNHLDGSDIHGSTLSDGILQAFAEQNQLFLSLPTHARHILLADAVMVSPSRGTELLRFGRPPRYGYFPLSGIAYLLSQTADGASSHIGFVGREGLVGAFNLLGTAELWTNCIVQASTTMLAVPIGSLREAFLTSDETRSCILGYVQKQIQVLAQMGTCNQFHSVEQRLARLLLITSDLTDSQVVQLKQEEIAATIGSRRTTISAASRPLIAQGIVTYKRGNVRIEDRARLEAISCSCYSAIQDLTSIT